jgi:hypothetical protein
MDMDPVHDCTANYRPILSSERMKKKEIVTQRNVKSGHLSQKGPDTKMNWLADHQSQYNSNFNIKNRDNKIS